MSVSIFSKTLSAAVAMFAFTLSGEAQSVEERMQKGDVLDKQLRAAEALEHYLPAEKEEPKNAELLTRIARQYRHLMADASSRSEKLRLGKIALNYSERAAALAPNDSDAQLSVGISLGKMLPILETKEQVAASPRIKSSAEKAIQLNPRNDLAWHILGRWHRVIADISPVKRALAPLIYGRLPKGTNEEAVKALQKALAINPRRLMHHIELGRAYAQMGRTADAKRHFSKGLSMPTVEKDDVEAKQKGREELAKLR